VHAEQVNQALAQHHSCLVELGDVEPPPANLVDALVSRQPAVHADMQVQVRRASARVALAPFQVQLAALVPKRLPHPLLGRLQTKRLAALHQHLAPDLLVGKDPAQAMATRGDDAQPSAQRLPHRQALLLTFKQAHLRL
jgi:hypothetical protein